MTTTTRIPVTAEHIERGHPMSRSTCPVALALTAVGHRAIYVDGPFAFTGGLGPLNVLYVLSEQVRSWIGDYDTNGPSSVAPVALTLRRENGRRVPTLCIEGEL